jgi:hypothetical protein
MSGQISMTFGSASQLVGLILLPTENSAWSLNSIDYVVLNMGGCQSMHGPDKGLDPQTSDRTENFDHTACTKLCGKYVGDEKVVPPLLNNSGHINKSKIFVCEGISWWATVKVFQRPSHRRR